MDGKTIDRLGRAWNAYCGDLDRQRLDDAVLDALGFTPAQRSAVARQLDTLASYRIKGASGGRDYGDDNGDAAGAG